MLTGVNGGNVFLRRDGSAFYPPLPRGTVCQVPQNNFDIRTEPVPYFSQLEPFGSRTGQELFEQLTSEELHVLYQGLQQVIVRRYSHDKQIDAADLTQEALTGFLQTYGQQRFKETRELLVFPNPSLLLLFGAARNKAAGYYREKYRQQGIRERLLKKTLPEVAEDVGQTTTNRIGAEQIVHQAAQHTHLSPMQQAILINQALGKPRTDAEIAADFCVKEVAVRVAGSRARRRLRAQARKLL